MTNFSKKVLNCCKQIPKGKITTYKKIAISIGQPNASRAVGNALNKNPSLVRIPCHRVVKSNGEISSYALGQKNKISLLKKEGIKIKNGKIDLEKYLFDF
jgi:methylated-DNA-[protein]-cysteine S-methyltransferase